MLAMAVIHNVSICVTLGLINVMAAAHAPHWPRSLQAASCDNMVPQDPCDFDNDQVSPPVYYTASNFGHTYAPVNEVQDFIVQQMSIEWFEVR